MQAYDKDRSGDAGRKLYGTKAWRNGRLQWLAAHPYCVTCEAERRRTMATEVDHKRPHRGDRALFFGRWNWQSMCKRCHSSKTAREDGGFGRASVVAD